MGSLLGKEAELVKRSQVRSGFHISGGVFSSLIQREKKIPMIPQRYITQKKIPNEKIGGSG